MSHHSGGEHGTGNAPSDGEPKVIDNATVGAEVTMSGGVLLSRDAIVDGVAVISGAVEVTDHGHIGDQAEVAGSVRIDGHAEVVGQAHISGIDIHIGDNASVSGNAVIVGEGIDIKDRAKVGGNRRVGSGAQLLHEDHVYSWSGGHDKDWTVFRTSGGGSNGIEGDGDETITDLIHNDRAPHELKRYVKDHTWK